MRRSPLLPIFLTVFVDVLGLTLVLPLLPYYALHFGASPLVVGCLAATYAVCQLVSGPILGRISDQVGRKPTLVVSQVGTFLGFLMLGFAHALWMLFLSRIIDGCTAGNLSIAQATISDATKPEERTKAFGLIGIAFGTGFLIGPAISGTLASRYGYGAPAFAAAALSALSIVLTTTMLPNTPPSATASSAPRRSLAFGRFFSRTQPRQRLLEFFAFTTSFSTLIGGLALYLARRFDFDVEHTGYVYALSGLVGAGIQGGIIGRLARALGETRLSLLGFATMALGYVFLGFIPNEVPYLVPLIVVSAFGSAVTRPALTTLLTRSVGPDEQGAVLGVSQSLAGISQIVGPIAAGWLIGNGWLGAYGLLAATFAGAGAILVRVQHAPDAPAA